MKKLICYLLATVCVLSIFPLSAWASEREVCEQPDTGTLVHQETIVQADGSTLEIRTVAYPSRSGNLTDGSKTYTYRNSSGTTLWTATLTARFSYDGTTSSCFAATLSLQFSDSTYYEVSRSVTKSGHTATANFTIGHRILGITISQTPYTMTLSCDKYGNLS